jgi:endonuclease YncB( thermonuclease family)
MMRALVLALMLLPAVAAAQTNFPIDLNHELQRRQQDRTDQIESGAIPRSGGIARPESSMPIEAERGDVVNIAGQRYRLWGIATPQLNEYGGYTAAQQLRQLIAGNTVTCITTGQMAERLPLARCRVNGKDVAALLVAGGFARDCPRQSRGNYAALERQAVVNVAGGFDLPPECVED